MEETEVQIPPERLDQIAHRFAELEARMASGTLEGEAFVRASRDYAELEPVAKAAGLVAAMREEVLALEAMREDPEFRAMAQEELANTEVEGSSGAGLVKVTMTCKHDVRRVAIDPSLLADDKDMLEDLVAAAFNDAVRRAEAVSQDKMSAIPARKPLHPGMKLPF